MRRRRRLPDLEIYGIERIPDADRNATILDFVRLSWGGANSLATAVLGGIPILFGLSLTQALWADVIGVVLGSAILSPMSVFGVLNGTNNAVSSSAHFGVVGRIVGSFLSLLTAVAFFAISVWTCGDALVSAAHSIADFPVSNAQAAFAYAVFALSVVIVCVYGFRIMLFVNKIAVVISTALFIVGFVAFAPKVSFAFPGSGLAWWSASFWPPFLSATIVALSSPISFGAFLGDWSRYLPRSTSQPKLILGTAISQLLSLLALSFGTITASAISAANPDYMINADYAGGLIALSPTWFTAPLIVLSILSGMSTGTTSLYGTGLDFSSVFPGVSRMRATLLIGSLSCALIFLGRFGFSLLSSITTFIALIVVTTTPWMVIMIVGLVIRRGHYDADAMQVFNRGQIGGPYWFHGGWNIAGMLSWLVSAALALAMVNIPGHFVGYLGNIAGQGLDVSLLAALVLPVFLYPACLFFFPEPRGIYCDRGSRLPWATEDLPIEPIRRASQ